MAQSGRLSHVEGLLATLFMGTHDKKVLKDKAHAHALRKLLVSRSGCKWESVHQMLREKVGKAVKMQSSRHAVELELAILIMG